MKVLTDSNNNVIMLNNQAIQSNDGGAVSSVNGKTGAVVLYGTDINMSSDTSLPTVTEQISSNKTNIGELTTEMGDKVDKVSGKGLSTNDYDNTEKSLVASALQPNDNVSELTNDAGYLTQHQSLSNYYNKTETDALLDDKQDALPTIVNDRYLHTSSTGELEWSEVSGGSGAVRYDQSQSLTDNQKLQARTNINTYSKEECDDRYARLATITITMVGSAGNTPTGDYVKVYAVNGTTETQVASVLYGTTSVEVKVQKNATYKITGTTDISGFYNPTSTTLYIATDVTATVTYFEVSTPSNASDIHNLIQLGVEESVMEVGDEFTTTWVATNGTSYSATYVVMDLGQYYTRHSDGQSVKGVRCQFKYGFPDMPQFDAPEKFVATEGTALANVYYYGLSGTTYSLLSLNEGDTIPYSDYDYVYKNSFRDTTCNIIKNGNNLLEYSAEHQWLNSDQTKGNWWSSTHVGDVAPSQATTIDGFMEGLDNNSFLQYILDEDFEIGQNTVIADGSLRTLHGKFRNPTVEEMYGSPQISGEGDGKYWEGWKLLCNNSETNPLSSPSNGYCGVRRIRNLENSSYSTAWLASCSRAYSATVWCANSGNGNLTNGNASGSNRCAPAFVIF